MAALDYVGYFLPSKFIHYLIHFMLCSLMSLLC